MKTLTKTTIVILSAVMLFACIGNFIKPLVTSAGLVGDINEDGIVNSKDLSMLQKIILGQYKEEETQEPTEEPAFEPTKEPIDEPSSEPLYFGDSFASMEELIEWMNDKNKRSPETSAKLLSAIEKDGGMFVPYIDGVYALDILRDDGNSIITRYGLDAANYGYAYRFKSEEAEGVCFMYFIDEENVEAAANDFVRYISGKYIRQIDDEDREIIIEKYGKTFTFSGESHEGIYYPPREDYPVEKLYFLYNEHFSVCLQIHKKESKLDVFEIAEKLTFELFPIEIEK